MRDKQQAAENERSDPDQGHLGVGMAEPCCSAVVEACADAIMTCDGCGVVVSGNPAAVRIFATRSQALAGQHLADIICPERLRECHKSELAAMFDGVNAHGMAERIVLTACRQSGEEFPVELTLVRLQTDTVAQFAVYLRDISVRKRNEEFTARQREILEMIGRRAPLSDILDAITDLLEKQMPGALCSIVTIDNENRLRTASGRSLPQAYNEAVNGTTIGPKVGSCGTAAFFHATVVVADIATDPLWENYRAIALEHNLRSCWSTPLLDADNAVVGTFAVYHRQPHAPAQQEIETVAAVSHLASLAIANQKAEDTIRESESRFRSVLENSQDANYRCDLVNGLTDYISPAITHITGYTMEEFVALGVKGLMDSIHPDDRPLVDIVVDQVNRGSLPYGNVEYRLKHRDGSYRWINDRFTTVRSSDGQPLYWIGSLQDIHSRKLIEDMLHASNIRYSQQQQALTRLTRMQILQTADLQDTLKEITETVSRLMEVERVSVWRFNDDRNAITSLELFEASANRHSSGLTLYEQDFPGYFRAMAESEIISAGDARHDPRTSEFAENYLGPLGITSMLDAPVQLSRNLDGVVCLEHVGPPRQWTSDEETFVVSIANLVALVLVQWELSHAEEAMRVSEANLANAQRIARLGSWTWDVQTGEQHWSDEVFELLGVSPLTTVPGHHIWTERVHPGDLSKVAALIEKSLADCSRYDCEYRIIQPDGTEVVLQEQAEVTCKEDGKARLLTGTILDITARKRAEERLLHDAMHDGLTGLANRKLITDHAGIAFHLFQRHNERRFALIMADLDRFKNVNDTLGHQMGDKVLQETAHRIIEAVRAGDTVARLGGDEFAVLLEDITDEETPTRVAQRILESMEAPVVIGDTVIDVGISMGVVVITPEHATTEQVFRDADIALYRAKDAGRGAYQVFDQEMHRRILERLKIEGDLRRAIERQELRLYLQPIVSLVSGQIIAFEALLRWKHPEKGMVSPAVFIPIAEETKQIIPIGSWVARRACEILRDWPGGGPPTISINVSPVQLLNPGNGPGAESRRAVWQWDNEIAALASMAGIDPTRLGIEVTEGVFINDPANTGKLLDRVVNKGFKLLLDDFGTGYSSLSYLQDLPFFRVKLDRAFTAKLHPGTRSHELMRGIITLAHNIGLEVVAEGVETEEQLQLLRSAGCDHAQGYLISHPLPVEEAQELYRSGRKW